ncbi:Uncharacterised protein [Chlamydia trachomatis]|nr:Uncharacterised protein [Chlamydia trachomatis]
MPKRSMKGYRYAEKSVDAHTGIILPMNGV